MYCSECGGEFRPGISECPDCQVALVEELPPAELHPDLELVTVFTADDPAAVVTAESLLAEAGVPFEETGDGLQYARPRNSLTRSAFARRLLAFPHG